MPISKPSLISIVDDKGNPLFKQNPAGKTNDSALQKGKPDLGFTPQKDFLSSSDPKEVGVQLNLNKSDTLDVNTKNELNKAYADSYDPASNGTVDFIHNLDRKIPSDSNTSNIYLGSSYLTRTENEDPTILGYDLVIDYATSPLFNGAVEDFLSTFTDTQEINSRIDTLREFKSQFYKFFKTSAGNSAQADIGGDGNTDIQPKVYYFKKITGLDRLVESNLSNDQKKSFVKYGEDFITIGLNEDVMQNMGYLSSLYKNLSWSRINGKQVIPENLLRFNLVLTITEIRKYNRVISIDRDNYGILADLISKYEYNLYECQLFFPKMPHGDSLDLSAPTSVDNYDIQFNYKFSTMKFIRFEYDNSATALAKQMDNQYVDIYQKNPKDAGLVRVGSSIELTDREYLYSYLETITNGRRISQNPTANKNSLTQAADQKSKFKQSLERLGGDLKRAAVNEINRQVVTQFRLLNRTLDNIRNAIPFAGRMSAPTNVYTQDQLSLSTDVQNAIRNFAGRSIKSLFGGSR